MRHLSLLSCLLFALPCFAAMPMPDVPRPEPEKSTACMRAYCDCNAFSLAQVPELGPASQACECGHSPAMHARELAPTFSGSTHASGSSAFRGLPDSHPRATASRTTGEPMGNSTIVIRTIGPSNNGDPSIDAEYLTAKFVQQLRDAGQNVVSATVCHGGEYDVTDVSKLDPLPRLNPKIVG